MPAAPRFRLPLALALGGLSLACGRFRDGPRTPEGPTSEMEANRYIRRAIRSSSEGWILLPSQRAERLYERPRLYEVAQGMRAPAARCFLARAILTMEVRTDDEAGYANVPEGQLKMRVRLSPSGEVLRAEVLETGFADDEMEPCIQQVVEEQVWPPNRSGNAHYIDAVYWVSLGMQGGLDPTVLRREQVAAGRRAKACLRGRVDAGRYEISGLNLVSREGATMANRVEAVALPDEIRACIATALRDIRLPRNPDAFVRPVSPMIAFNVGSDGVVRVDGERWLELVELEEKAQRAAERDALATGDQEVEDEFVDTLPPRRPQTATDSSAALPRAPLELAPTDAPPTDPGTTEPEPSPKTRPAGDPGKGGLQLDLGGRKRGDDA